MYIKQLPKSVKILFFAQKKRRDLSVPCALFEISLLQYHNNIRTYVCKQFFFTLCQISDTIKNMKRNNILKKRNLHRTVAVLLAMLLLCTSFSGCNTFSGILDDYFGLTEPLSEFVSEPVSEITSEEPSEEPENSVNPDFFFAEEIPNPVWEAPSGENDFPYSLDRVPDIGTTEEFNEYFLFMMENRQRNISFNAINGFEIDNNILLYRFSTPYVSSSRTELPDNKVYWDISIGYYPGLLISDAYLKKDPSSLSGDDLTVYKMASEFIEKTVLPEKDLLVRERLIHDYICSHAVYSNPGSREHMPRYCTATGLLLDGAANCQGYTDCFYMLSRMAGFEVEKQSGWGGSAMHVWNIIKIKGEWRAVDVTFDDTSVISNGSMYQSYAYFNVGKDLIEYTHRIDDGNELLPISPTSDKTYFYYSDSFDDRGYSSDLEEAKKEIALLLDNVDTSYDSVVSYLILDNFVWPDDLTNEIKLKLKVQHPGLTIYTYHMGNHTFVCAAPR